MRIAKSQVVAGYPALTVRTLLRRCRSCTIVPATAAHDLKSDEREGSVFLRGLASLGLVESVEHEPRDETQAYEITSRGLACANASAAKPITRRTANSALAQFMERLHAVNANAEYLHRVESALLFGSMLTEIERLGDVDLAVELSPKTTGEMAFDEWCDRRRHAALETGQRFRSTFDWAVWPKKEERDISCASRALPQLKYSRVGPDHEDGRCPLPRFVGRPQTDRPPHSGRKALLRVHALRTRKAVPSAISSQDEFSVSSLWKIAVVCHGPSGFKGRYLPDSIRMVTSSDRIAVLVTRW